MKISIDIKSGEINDSSKKNQEIIAGIDLGTTNSLIAYIVDGEPVSVASDGKTALVPSIINFDNEDKPTIGYQAKNQLTLQPERTIYSVKRLMGKSYQDLTQKGFELGYKVIDNPNEDNKLVKIQIGDKFYTPIELSSLILKELKSRIETSVGQTVTKVVITVPAYFNDAQRQATRDAGKLAGFDVLRIVNEPTAAALAYGIGLSREEEKLVAVYDLGGGTFDISILQIQNGIFEVLATHGDTFLGGDDFDNAILKYWIEKYGLENNQALRLTAEEAKKSLSTQEAFVSVVQGQEVHLSRKEFEDLIAPIIAQSIDACRRALKDADVEKDELDAVILVGGSTRALSVKEKVSQFFGIQADDSLDPDKVVAQGAAIQADVLAGNRKDVLLLDVTPLSLGIETVGGLMDVILPRNSKIPSRVGRNYTTSVDGQKNLKVAVFQGERDLVKDNRLLGDFILKGIPPMPAGIPKIEIQFILDADGILTVKAMEHRSNTETEIQIKSAYGISEEEMGRMLLESLQNAEADTKIKALLEARNEANNIIMSTEKFIEQNESILSDDEQKSLIILNEELRQITAGEDKDAINAAMEKLNEYATPLAHRALDHNIAENLKSKKL